MRNFDSRIRQLQLESDGIVGEVIFPNTIPPFFPSGTLTLPDPTPEQYELRWAGIRAHNRWLADFCNELPGRRAGVAQLLLNDVDDALAEVRRVKAAGLFGGVMIPNIAPDSPLPPLHAPVYEPLWALCEELELPVNMHGGTGVPNLGPYPATPALMFLEFGWYAQRPLLRLLFSGVFERHPELTFIMTEQGNSWVPGLLAGLDWAVERMLGVPGQRRRDVRRRDRAESFAQTERVLGAAVLPRRELHGAARLRRTRGHRRRSHHVGKRLPAQRRNASLHEGSAALHLRRGRRRRGATSCSEPTRRTHTDSTSTRCRCLASKVGPRVADVAEPLGADEFPEDALSPALDRMRKPVGNIS